MNLNFIAVIFFLIVFVVFFLLKKKQNGIEFNFILFFSLGYIYYFLTPLLFIANFKNLDLEELDVIRGHLERISDTGMQAFGVLSIFYYLLTAAGFYFGKKIYIRKNANKKKIANNNKLKIGILFFLGLTLVLLTAIPIRDNFFKGYDASIFEGYTDGVLAGAAERGTYIAAVTLFFTIFLIQASSAYLNQAHGSRTIFSIYFKNIYFYIYLIFAVLMVSLGGRLYLISHLIAVFVMINIQKNYVVSWGRVFLIFISLAVMLGLYGVFRAKGELTFNAILLNLAQEPLYTSISLFSYVGGGYWEAFRFPYFLLSDFINLLPSFIWENKASYILQPSQLGFDIGIPLGGFHLFVSLMLNFGYLGAGFFMLIFGWFFGFLEKRSINYKFAVIYSLLVGWCTFSIFRDPFSVVFVKNIFQYSIVIPLIFMKFIAK